MAGVSFGFGGALKKAKKKLTRLQRMKEKRKQMQKKFNMYRRPSTIRPEEKKND